MYFDFDDRYSDVEPVGRAINLRDGIGVSVVVHAIVVLLLVFGPQFLPDLTPARQDDDIVKLESAEEPERPRVVGPILEARVEELRPREHGAEERLLVPQAGFGALAEVFRDPLAVRRAEDPPAVLAPRLRVVEVERHVAQRLGEEGAEHASIEVRAAGRLPDERPRRPAGGLRVADDVEPGCGSEQRARSPETRKKTPSIDRVHM